MSKENNVTKLDLSKVKANEDDNIHKVDLSKPNQDEAQEVEANDGGVEASDETTTTAQDQEDLQPETGAQEVESVLEEIVEEVKPEDVVDITDETESTEVDYKVDLNEEKPEAKSLVPDNVQKLIDFMKETGGDLQDYVRLNTDVSNLDTTDVLDEYYKQTKPHLSADERSFLLEETFSYDEEVDTDKDIKRKKIALKEEAAKARKYLESQKDKYYREIKAGSNLSDDQKEAIEFYNKYKQDSEVNSKTKEHNTKEFLRKTENLFNSDFKGFEFNVGEKKFRYNVKNINEVKTTQSDLNNFVSKFVDSKNQLQDAAGYHKSLYTAMNADALAQHFYEQGKADAIKQTVAQSKNINTEARQTHGETQAGGFKYKVLGGNSNDFKVKIKNKR
jgi:hypothetical protein